MGLFNSVKTPDNTTHTVSLPYGYCETAAGTAAKTVTVPNVSELTTGLAIIVRFKNSNSASSPTLNVNGLGAKNIYRYGTTKASTSTTVSGWIAGAVQLFVYNGTGWVRDYWSNTTYTNAALGQGFVICDTDAATAEKTCSISSYTLATGGVVAIQFTNGNTASSPTLNITEKGAKPIYYNGAVIDDDTLIQPDDICTFIYDSTSGAYHLLANDRWYKDIQTLNVDKMDKNNPVGYGALSINRRDSSVTDDSSIAIGWNTSAMGSGSFAEGTSTKAVGTGSHAEGYSSSNTIDNVSDIANPGEVIDTWQDNKFLLARGNGSHAEGYDTLAYSTETPSHAEGYKTISKGGYGSHSEGYQTWATEMASHAEGMSTTASGEGAHAEGVSASASGQGAHAEGTGTSASSSGSHAEGSSTSATGSASHAEGRNSYAYGNYSHAEGGSGGGTAYSSSAYGMGSHAEGYATNAVGSHSHAEGVGPGDPNVITLSGEAGATNYVISGSTKPLDRYVMQGCVYVYKVAPGYPYVTGYDSTTSTITLSSTLDSSNALENAEVKAFYAHSGALGESSHTEGFHSGAMGNDAHAEGYFTQASGIGSHAEGQCTKATGHYSHAEGGCAGGNTMGSDSSEASGLNSHAEGSSTLASDEAAHAEGYATQALDTAAHAEGYNTIASGLYAHSEGGSYYGGDSKYGDSGYSGSRTITITGGDPSYQKTIYGPYAAGNNSHAEGGLTYAKSVAAHAEGSRTSALGQSSHAEGNYTIADGIGAHAEGENTIASGDGSHAEGYLSAAKGAYSHAEGEATLAVGYASHAEGYKYYYTPLAITTIIGTSLGDADENGYYTLEVEDCSGLSVGMYVSTGCPKWEGKEKEETNATRYTKQANHIDNYAKIVEKDSSNNLIKINRKLFIYPPATSDQLSTSQLFSFFGGAYGAHSHTSGENCFALGENSHAEGAYTVADGENSHAEGYRTHAEGENSHAEGGSTEARGKMSHAEGAYTIAAGNHSHAEGFYTYARGDDSHTEGYMTEAYGENSHAEGFKTGATGNYSHAEGYDSSAVGKASHAEGGSFDPSGIALSKSEPLTITNGAMEVSSPYAAGHNSHAEGCQTLAYGYTSHAEGFRTSASGSCSHAGGYYTSAASDYQTAIGKYNKVDKANTYSFIIGNGTSDSSADRKNAFTVDWSGNGVFSGGITATNFNGYTIEKSVPSDAKFTDTTYSAATTSANGLMTSAMVTKLNGITAGAQPNVVTAVKTAGAGSGGKAVITMADGTKWYFPTLVAGSGTIATTWLPKATSSAQGIVQVGSNMTVSNGTISLTKSNVTSALGYTPTKKEFIFDTYSKSVTINPGDQSVTVGALTQRSGYTLLGYINQNGGYTDQWLISYGTYGSNVVAMVHSKYSGTLTQTISCTAIWYKNQ